jgi:hypothetical protein
VTLWEHNADNGRRLSSTVKTDPVGFCTEDKTPKWWTAYKWVFAGNTAFAASTSNVVTSITSLTRLTASISLGHPDIVCVHLVMPTACQPSRTWW